MTISREQKFALRKGAPANLKMSVSRPAKRVRTLTGVNAFSGVGNMTSYVQSVLADRSHHTGVLSKQEQAYLVSKVNRYLDSTGRVPSADTIVDMVGN